MIQRAAAAAFVLISLVRCAIADPGLPSKPNFSRDIRSILSDKCFQCHGPDEAKREGALRLDLREAALAPAASGKSAIVPGKLADSELVARILSRDPDVQMPPPESKKTLTDSEIELLKQWVAADAPYEGHWAFTTPVRPEVPSNITASNATEQNWLNHPVDRFLLARLQKEGLHPTEEADRATLIRRASLDLTGLPPSPEDVRRYMEDKNSDAYGRMLDGVFRSPHYGERMALGWLDMARYADSNGFQSDGSRDIWAWRDWVVQAYNDNKPFDQFTIEQLAGDMLPNASRDQIIATGFNRNHRLNGEGGRIVDEWFVETVIDRVETTGLTWLGLTLNCTRCHDHKYDPISQKEFYQLFAFFNSVEEQGVLAPEGKNGENTPPLLKLTTKEHESEIALREATIERLKERLATAKQEIPALTVAWAKNFEPQAKKSGSVWHAVIPTSVESTEGATLTRQEDGTYLASGKNPANDVYRVRMPLSLSQVSGILLEVFPDPSLPSQSLGRASNGNFVVTDVMLEVSSPAVKRPKRWTLERAEADFSQNDWPASEVVKNKPFNLNKKPPANRKGWAIEGNNPERRVARKAIFVAKEPIAADKDAELIVTLGHFSQYANHNIGRFRVSITDVPPQSISLDGGGLPANIQSILAAGPDRWNAEERKVAEEYFVSTEANPVRDTQKEIDTKTKELADYKLDLPTTMVMKEAAKPRDAFVLLRGEYDKPKDKVERAVPAVLPPLPNGAPVNRLGLAQWIVHRSNPLTARVWVNREWERFFGFGIVKTTENLGSQSEYPVHRELLDWLSVEFMEPTQLPSVNGQAARAWDMKAFQKFVMMSAAYRQASRVTPDRLEKDPDNRLLARGPRFRLPGEIVRDSALSVSGLLVSKIGGPSVRPYMPEGVWDETSKYGNLRNYKPDQGEGLYRRSMYTIWKRTAAPPTMLIFDAPNREVCTVKRSRTNTPLQALSLLNEVTFVEAARKLAMRMIAEGGSSTEQRLAYGFQLALARAPKDSEMKVLVEGWDSDMKRFASEPEAAEKLLAVGASKAPTVSESPTPAEVAAYTLAANVILNLDEFVTRE